MPSFTPADPEFDARVRASFAQQGAMHLIGAEIAALAPGLCTVALPYRPELAQQDGFFHAGMVTTIVDTACGYAAFSLMPAAARVLTVELKLNLMAPARGERLLATGRVERAGRTLTVVRGCGSHRGRPVHRRGADAGNDDVPAAARLRLRPAAPSGRPACGPRPAWQRRR
jgi:uncharacterized protein (TIGR00369 family)